MMQRSDRVISEVFEANSTTRYHIRATLDSHRIEFRVVKVEGYVGDDDTPRYGDDFITDPDLADAFWEGSIKWDGCSNWNFMTNECMAHFCGREDAVSIGALMGRLYDIAATNLPTWDAELGA